MDSANFLSCGAAVTVLIIFVNVIAEVHDEIVTAQKEAEAHGTLHAGGSPSVREMFEGVYKDMPPHLRRQRQDAGV